MERIEEIPALEGVEPQALPPGPLPPGPLPPGKDLPAWAATPRSRGEQPPPPGVCLAECPGCIAEQEIHHTCGIQEDSGNVTSRNSSSKVEHTCQQNGHGGHKGHHQGHNQGQQQGKASYNKWQEAHAYQTYIRERGYPGHGTHPVTSHPVTTPEKLMEVDPRYMAGDSPERGYPHDPHPPHTYDPKFGAPLPPHYFDDEYRSHDQYHPVRHMYPGSHTRGHHPHYHAPHPPSHPHGPGHPPGHGPGHGPGYGGYEGYEGEVCYQCTPHPPPVHRHYYPHYPPPHPRDAKPPDRADTDHSDPSYVTEPRETPRDSTPRDSLNTTPRDKQIGNQGNHPETSNNKLSTAHAQAEDDTDLQPTKEETPSREGVTLPPGPPGVPGPDVPSQPGMSPGEGGGSPGQSRKDHRRSIPSAEGDLETVKKGSALYGQPSWWGEDDAEDNKADSNGPGDPGEQANPDRSPDRPNSLSLQNGEKPGGKYGSAYMEIPQKDTNGTALLSQDPHQKAQTPPERDTGPGSPPGGQSPGSPDKVMSAPTAFTVDLGEDTGVRMGAGVSGYLPPRLRRSLRQRAPKREDSVEGEETNGNASPARQRKFDTTKSPKLPHKSPRAPRKSGGYQGYHSDGHNSALSSDNEDISIRSDTVTTRAPAKRTKTPPSSRVSSARSGERKTTSVRASADTKKSPRTPKMERKAQKTPTSDRKKQVTPNEYLFEKMYTAGEKDDSPESAAQPPEFELYREAQVFDRVVKSGVVMPQPVASSSEPTLTVRKSLTSAPARAETRKDGRNDVRNDVPDNVSETGTYTIEVEPEKDDEFEISRRSIGKIFGLEGDEEMIERPVIDAYEDDSPNDDDRGTPTLPEASLDVTTGGTPRDPDDIDDVMADPASSLTSDAPDWVNRWAALKSKPVARGISGTAQIIQVSQGETGEVRESSGSVQSVHSCTLPGTTLPGSVGTVGSVPRRGIGRRLPTPPVVRPPEVSSGSPVLSRSLTPGSDRSTPRGSIEFDKNAVQDADSGPGRHRATVQFESDSGSFCVSFDAPQREQQESRDMPRDEVTVSEMFESGMKTDAVLPARSQQTRSPRSRTHDTEDTEVFLRDTENMIASMQDRGAIKPSPRRDLEPEVTPVQRSELMIPVRDLSRGRGESDLDSDASSSGCVVDGDLDLPRSPPFFRRSKSVPRQAAPRLAKSRSVEPEVTPRVKSASYTRSAQPRTRTARKSSTGSTSYGGDVESQSETASVISSSTDYSETTSPRMPRRASGGKGAITTIKTNRAFQIRRQKADGGGSDTETSATLTPRSRASSASREKDAPRSQRGTASSRSRSSSRNRPTSAQDAKDKAKVTPGRKTQEMTRKDGGRYSLRGTKSATPTSAPSIPRDKPRVSSARTPRSAPHNSSLHRTTPTGGTQSPRSQELTAWQRRKSYDPRKAAAEGIKKSNKLNRSKSATEEGAARRRADRSVSSASSEEAFDVTSSSRRRTEEISQFSSIMVDQLSQMSRTTAEEDITFRSIIGPAESSHRSAFSPHKIIRPALSGTLPTTSTTAPPGGTLSNSTTALATVVNGHHDDKPSIEPYDPVMVNSIFQLSRKVKDQTDRIVNKLRRDHGVFNEPSPTYEGIIKNANPELASVLSNLRKTEHQLQVIDKTLNSGMESSSPEDPNSYLRELESLRAKSQSLGFKPIQAPSAAGRGLCKQGSSGSDPLGGDDYY